MASKFAAHGRVFWMRTTRSVCALASVGSRARALSSAAPTYAASTATTTSSIAQPATPELLEQITYRIAPAGMSAWVRLANEAAALRSSLDPSFRGAFQTNCGGALNTVTVMHTYANMTARTAQHASLAKNVEWQRLVDRSLAHVVHYESTLFQDVAAVRTAAALPTMSTFKATPADIGQASSSIYELRTYQLILGYNPVPLLAEAFRVGIPAKLRAAQFGQLVGIAASEIGDLNKVVELWRFDSADACMQHRVASRAAPEWKAAIAKIAPSVQSFNTTLLHPLSCSQWQ